MLLRKVFQLPIMLVVTLIVLMLLLQLAHIGVFVSVSISGLCKAIAIGFFVVGAGIIGVAAIAFKKAKTTSFYKHCGFKGATSHIDDKYGVDVDDIHEIEDILSPQFKEKFQLKISKSASNQEDVLEIGYVKIDKLLKDG